MNNHNTDIPLSTVPEGELWRKIITVLNLSVQLQERRLFVGYIMIHVLFSYVMRDLEERDWKMVTRNLWAKIYGEIFFFCFRFFMVNAFRNHRWFKSQIKTWKRNCSINVNPSNDIIILTFSLCLVMIILMYCSHWLIDYLVGQEIECSHNCYIQ